MFPSHGMNRSKKYCLYRDCPTNSANNPDITLFKFPNNKERASKWCELGAVDPSDARPRFMCELHFSRIYKCSSVRRKMLVNTAIPRAFGTNETEEEKNQALEQSLIETEVVTIEEHLDESMTDESDELPIEITEINQQELDNTNGASKTRRLQSGPPIPSKIIKLEKLSSKSHSVVDDKRNPLVLTPPKGTILRKVKLVKDPSTNKTIIIKSTKPVIHMPPEPKLDVKDEVSPAHTVASSSNNQPEKEEKNTQAINIPDKKDEAIYEFIFKGEEYIQMPKAKYFTERKKLEQQWKESLETNKQLVKKIQHYQRSVKDLKKFLHNICEDSDVD